MRTIVACLSCLLILGLFAASGHADTIVSVSGTPSGSGPVFSGAGVVTDPQFLGLSFSLNGSFSDVAITALNINAANLQGTAWLTTAIGPTASSLDVVASAPFGAANNFTSITFLSGMDLAAGTYYFFLSSPFCGGTDVGTSCGEGTWQYVNNPMPSGLPGDQILGLIGASDSLICSPPQTCGQINFNSPVASDWQTFTPPPNSALGVEITGNANAVPEPPALLLISAPLALLILMRRR